ncbi:hypothetical protein BHE74_00014068, partial [Ensete ventricosum]
MRIQWKPIKRTKLQSTGTVGVQRSPPTVARDREKKRKERMRGRNRSPSSGDWVAEPGGGRQLRRRERESALRHRSEAIKRGIWVARGHREACFARPRLPSPFGGNDDNDLLALRLVPDWDS